MDIFLTRALKTVILLVGPTHLTVYQTHKPRRYKNSVGGSYIIVYEGEFISFDFSDLKSGFLKGIHRFPPIEKLGEFDYKQLVDLFRKEFGEK